MASNVAMIAVFEYANSNTHSCRARRHSVMTHLDCHCTPAFTYEDKIAMPVLFNTSSADTVVTRSVHMPHKMIRTDRALNPENCRREIIGVGGVNVLDSS